MNAETKNNRPKQGQNRNRRPGGKPGPRPGGKPGGGSGGGPKGNRRPRYRGKGRGPGQGQGQKPGNPLDALYRKYFNLLDQHLVARKKYFGFFFRSDPNQKAKLERVFYNTLDQLRKFEATLKDDQKVLLEKRVNGLELDSTYSTNHELEFEAEKIEHEGDYDDPHYLPSQIDSSFQSDTEESVGSIDDYKKLKGL